MNKFDDIQAVLGLTEKEKAQYFYQHEQWSQTTLQRSLIGLGGTHSAVYAEVSSEEYLAYTTEETESWKSCNWQVN
jgi:hypothetical protein